MIDFISMAIGMELNSLDRVRWPPVPRARPHQSDHFKRMLPNGTVDYKPNAAFYNDVSDIPMLSIEALEPRSTLANH